MFSFSTGWMKKKSLTFECLCHAQKQIRLSRGQQAHSVEAAVIAGARHGKCNWLLNYFKASAYLT
jgi:hypothetical protein